MNINARWLFGAYLGVAVFTALSNLPVTTVVTKIDTGQTKGATIPLENIASLPAIRDNGGVVPIHVQTAQVEIYLEESHRGWPWFIENKYGYRYDFINPTANYFATLTEFPNYKGIIWQHLIVNFAGTLAIVFGFHMSLILFFRSRNAMNTTASQRQAV